MNINKIILTAISIFLTTIITAQGVNFETGTWDEVLTKAKAQNKLIYVDVYTTWCGPCKAMARNIFPNEDAGKKYNALFINYKTDAEKEGRALAAKYSVTAYPTNLYINPHNEEVVYRVAGGCGVEEFIARADRASADFNDPMSWEEYNKQLESKSVTKDFVMKYIEKARRLGKSHDRALDIYKEKFIVEPVSNEELAYLASIITTFDNKMFPYLKSQTKRINEIFNDRPQFFENQMRTILFQGTFKKAIENKDIKVLETAKPIIQEYSSANAEGAWLGFMAKYYESVGNIDGLYQALKQSTLIYDRIKPTEYGSKDLANLAEHKKNIQRELISNGVPAEKIGAETDKILLSKPDLSKSFTNNAINTYNAIVQHLIKHKVNDKKKLTEGLSWAKRMSDLTVGDVNLYPSSLKQQAYLHYKLGNKDNAIATIQKAIDYLKSQNKPTTSFEQDIQMINNGTFDIIVK